MGEMMLANKEAAAQHATLEWTTRDVADELAAAMSTLQRLPPEGGPQGMRAGWPDVVRTAAEAYGAQATRVRPGAPPARDISRMDRAFGWLFWIEDKRDRQILLALAVDTPRRDLELRFGLGRRAIFKRAMAAYMRVTDRLNREKSNL